MVMISGSRWPDAAADFYKAYLFAWLFFLGISLGAMMAVMIHHLTGGEWGYFVRRFGEAAANVLPLLFVLFLPILARLHWLYPWADPHNHSAIVAHKTIWLNPGFFILRYIIYFALWIPFAWRLRALSLRHDRAPSKNIEMSLGRLSAVGLVIYFVTMSLASVDWVMSLEPEWFSTVFGFIVCMGQGVSGTCVLIIVMQRMNHDAPFAPRIRPKHFNDMATLLITAVIMWAYTSFSQLLVVWMGNIQSEIPWYVQRSFGPWRVMSILLVYLGFMAPFVLLLQRGVKNNGKTLTWVSGGILVMQALDTYWWITPSGVEPYPEIHWLNVVMSLVALIGIGGVWIAAFLWLLGRAPLMPGGDAVPIRLTRSNAADLEHGNIEHGTEPGTNPGIA